MDPERRKSPTARRDRRHVLGAAAMRGDERAYESLLRDCIPLIRAVATRRGIAPDRIDDVVQDALLTIHRARASFDPAYSFDGWVAAIADRRAVDQFRSMSRHRHRELHEPLLYEAYAEDGAHPVRWLEAVDDARLLDRLMSRLPPCQKEAVHHLGRRERTLSEAAERTGKTKGSLKVNYHRAMKSLRASVERA